ncbi:transcriptional regulator, XRE family with cupin sensor [Caminicella sporogenes DSM 14501]|uniref:Transcriptional regulator, XRE family with cupin sensor n=1 Tax=Caminicella sporogenes DSM 14501 TaxID=1121266 RepID=A0A1M6T577_9FIRM|nr:cupin domain-containing protein [Caminicella sporogenes]RKD25479.1 DNA-binding protein [Caminicella sporogenes]SHK52016.1 transcriptional regulator, XRE family with cupin sensor [Caminicella sporogenes DSM 14501]
MSTNISIGKKIKQLRTNKKLTLKDLSNMTNLSTGFLSQLERGLTTIAIDSLEKIAKALEVNLSYFFDFHGKKNKSHIIRSYEQTVFQVKSDQFIQYHLSNDIENAQILPRLIEILPMTIEENINEYQHEGEEFIYVLEGILTLFINHQRYDLYPGDSAYFHSTYPHNWVNYTNKLVKIITVHTPNPFKLNKKNQ